MVLKITAGVILIQALCLLSSRGDPECGPEYKDWDLYEGYCYYVTGRIGSAYTWHEANKFCMDRGAHLASVHSDEENLFLTKHWLSYHPTVWLGLNAIGDDSAYTWTDGTKLDYARVNASKVDTSKGRCTALSTPGPEKIWYFMHCEEKAAFACKRPQYEGALTITPPVTIVNPGNCPTNWTRIGNKCFRIFSGNSGERFNHSTAVRRCKSLGMNIDMAAIHTEEENIKLTTMASEEKDNLWIGLYRINFSNFGWTDNTDFDYTNWAPGEPTSVAEGCVELITSKFRAGLWNDISCRKEYGYVCQRQPDPSATTPMPPPEECTEEGFSRFGSSCYRVISGSYQMTWSEAESDCGKYGGHLASIHSATEMAFVKGKLLTEPQGQLWIGLSTDQKGQLQWTDGWPMTYFDLNNTIKNFEPSKCTFLNENYTWSLVDCQQKRGYVCKISSERPPDYPEMDPRPCPDHVKDLVDVGLKDCYAIRMEYASWGGAYQRCLKNDSSLVSFHYQHEIDLLSPYIAKRNRGFWIGKYRKYTGAFEWVDKSDTSFDMWDSGEPSSKHDCVEFSHLTLKSSTKGCDESNAYICSYPKGK